MQSLRHFGLERPAASEVKGTAIWQVNALDACAKCFKPDNVRVTGRQAMDTIFQLGMLFV